MFYMEKKPFDITQLFHVFVGNSKRNPNMRVNGNAEMRFTKFPALFFDPRVRISRSVFETDD